MPLHPSYADLMASDIADIKNSTEGSGPGAGLAAHFVGYFVDASIPWAHVDMAGPNLISASTPLTPKGMTGYGVRLLEAMARDWRPEG
jgi:leucyl aminopeptidase